MRRRAPAKWAEEPKPSPSKKKDWPSGRISENKWICTYNHIYIYIHMYMYNVHVCTITYIYIHTYVSMYILLHILQYMYCIVHTITLLHTVLLCIIHSLIIHPRPWCCSAWEVVVDRVEYFDRPKSWRHSLPSMDVYGWIWENWCLKVTWKPCFFFFQTYRHVMQFLLFLLGYCFR